MNFISITFLLFLAVLFIVYYAVRPKYRWIVLLTASVVFYLFCGWKAIFYLLSTSLTVYTAARLMDKTSDDFRRALGSAGNELSREDKLALRDRFKRRKSIIFLAALIVNLGVLAVVKYSAFACESITSLLGALGSDATVTAPSILVPMGLSFYTFQALGYLIDVKRGKYPAEKNYARFALFISFFPQLIQGPISRYDDLGQQLKKEHRFNYDQFVFGAQLAVWGFFKKMVIADHLAAPVARLFDSYESFTGPYYLLAAVLYSVQIYMDFSGGIDIARGVAQCLGIELPLNFERPFFSKSLSEFWRRWHISLGAWMRDYVFYPISLSSAWTKLGKWARTKISKNAGKTIPSSLTAFVVFFIIGVWHGASWNFVVYGLYNASIIALSTLLEPFFEPTLNKLHIRSSSFGWKVFQMARTTLICGVGRVIAHAATLTAAFTMLGGMFTGLFKPSLWVDFYNEMMSGTEALIGIREVDLIIAFVGTLVVFCVSVMQERGIKMRERIAAQKLPVRWLIWIALILIIIMFGAYGAAYSSADFIYGGY